MKNNVHYKAKLIIQYSEKGLVLLKWLYKDLNVKNSSNLLKFQIEIEIK